MTSRLFGNLRDDGCVGYTNHEHRTRSFVALACVAAVAMWAGAGAGCGGEGSGGAPVSTPGATPPTSTGGTGGSVGPASPTPSAAGNAATTSGTSMPKPPQTGGTTGTTGAAGTAAVAAAAGQAAMPPQTPMGQTTAGSMSTPTVPDQKPVDLPVEMGKPTLFWLDIVAGTVTTASADGSGAKRFASGSPLSAPDGVTVDPMGGHVFVLNMGSVIGGANTGSLVRYKLDGSSPEVIMKPGTMVGGERFNTGKQVTIDKVNRKLYLGDREGSKVWRCDLDGQNLEVLVSGHSIQQIVGVAADPTKGHFYFSDRNGRKLFRANMKMPDGKTHADRDDLELLYVDKASNAMPLDLELDLSERKLFWTDRDQNKIFSMGMDLPMGQDAMTRTDVKTVASNLVEAIGLGYDHETKTLYVTHGGSVSSLKSDGSGLKRIGSSGSTGIAFTKIP